MDSILAKFILTIASIFAVLTGSNYIKVAENDLVFNFKTGGNFPIYYFLNVENVGPQKVRFDVSSNANWVFVYREGQSQPTDFVSLELPQNAPINFVLEIHPERLEDKTHNAEISIKAIQLQDYSVLDTKKISITLNKNIQITPTPTLPPAEAEVSIQTPLTSPTITPALSPTPTLKLTPKPASPVSPKIEAPASERVKPIIRPLEQLIESLRLFVKFLFRF